MGCKQSKYAIGDEGQQYIDGQDPYKGDPTNMDGMYNRPPIETEIIPAHRYIGAGGQYPGCDQTSQRPLAPNPPEPINNSFCPSDAQFTQMAEGCTAGFLEMFSLSSNKKLITNEPSRVNAYQQPAFNYRTPHSVSENSHNSQAHSQSSQRRAVLVQSGSFAL